MPATSRIHLVVLFGGRSAEHDISRVSAFNVLRSVDRDRYDVTPIGIERDGTWRRCSDNTADPDATAIEIDGEAVNPFDVLKSPDTVVFPVLHGPNGEDGTMQGLLEVVGVPYVGSGVLGSAVSMDKAMAKTVLGAHQIAQPHWRSIQRYQINQPGFAQVLDAIVDELGEELFVKPANMGSSIGVSKANGATELRMAIDMALNYDDIVIIEEAVTAREIEIAVLGNEELSLGSIGEVRPAADFYDYEDKYSDGVADVVIPAVLSPAIESAVRETAVAAYRALRAEGLARVDLFVNEDHPDPSRRVMVNEINTLPGFTQISVYPQSWEHAGVSNSDLIDKLVDLARQRHQRVSAHHVDVISTRDDQ